MYSPVRAMSRKGQAELTLGLLPNAHILLMSTVPPTQAVALSGRLREYRSDIRLIDCPVSGGTPRAATGDLMILAGGLDPSSAGMTHALRILQILSGSQGNTSNLVRVPGGVGKGSAVKLVNQHLAGESFIFAYLWRNSSLMTNRYTYLLCHGIPRLGHAPGTTRSHSTSSLPEWSCLVLDDGA